MLLLDATSIKICHTTEGAYNLEQATEVCNDQKELILQFNSPSHSCL